jgi:hypothetical protein
VNTWTVTCGSCDHRWTLVGRWTVYETSAIESRPCPCCGAYTLRSPEPVKASRPRLLSWAAEPVVRAAG